MQQQRAMVDLKTCDKFISVRNTGAPLIVSPEQHYFSVLAHTKKKKSLLIMGTADAASSRKLKTGEVVKTQSHSCLQTVQGTFCFI